MPETIVHARPVATARPAVRVSARTVVNVLVLGALGWLLVWLSVSDRFYVNQVVVQGNQRVSAEAIVAASGIQGFSIFWVDAKGLSEAITGTLPPIKQVRVRYGLPNVVTLAVEEEGEQVMWSVAGKRYWVDEEGMLHPALGGDDPNLLVRDVRPGLPTQVDKGAIVAASQLAALLPDLESVDYSPVRGLHFSHPKGWIVYMGTGDDMLQKVQVLRAIEQRLSVEGVRQPDLVDVRFPKNPYYRYPDE